MSAMTTLLLQLVALPGLVWPATIQSSQSQKTARPSGSVSGRIQLAGKPAPNISVSLMPDPSRGRPESAGISATTDAEGRYRLTNVAAGRFYVAAYAPAYYSEEGAGYYGGKPVNIDEGEQIEDLNLALRRGGVITGRLTDSTGHPVIQERIVLLAGPQGQRNPIYTARNMLTDDRGIYRIYGIPPGRYLVYAGSPKEDAAMRFNQGSVYFPQTFYPGVSDVSQAVEVEVTEGGEAAGIDIALADRAAAYTVTGQVVDATTGKPVAGLPCGYGFPAEDGGSHIRSMSYGGISNERGEFRIEGIVPGKYLAFVFPQADAGYNCTPVPFEVTEGDVHGLVIRLRAGSSISGSVTVEGTMTPEIAAQLRELRIGAIVSPVSSPTGPGAQTINPDGTFRIAGLTAGNAKISIFSTRGRETGFSLARIERDGVVVSNGLDLGAGEEVSGVRLVLQHGSGVIRGEVRIGEGSIPDGIRIFVTARRSDEASNSPGLQSQADARGHFIFENLLPGDYEIAARAIQFRSGTGPVAGSFQIARQTVTVTGDAESTVKLVIEQLNKPN